jgi:hypothetical protein
VTSPSPHAERRRADRAAASFPVRISNKPDAEPAMLRDISEIGLACLSSHEVPEMTLVGLDFALPGATEIPDLVLHGIALAATRACAR